MLARTMILAVLQARMSSTRLPGKVMRPLAGEPMIGRQIERLRRAASLDRLVVATSTGAEDDPLAAYCEGLGAPVFRGPLDDVLGRFAAAAEAFGPAEAVVRLTADCPLADPEVVDEVVRTHLASGADYTSNVLPNRTFPKGLDVEAVRTEALLSAAREAADPYEREHVTPFLYRRPERFRIASVERSPSLADLRWTVDTPEDYAFVCRVYDALYAANPAFTSQDILRLSREQVR
jgi:spore coat polysaccharide biosynthesis protein SpsF